MADDSITITGTGSVANFTSEFDEFDWKAQDDDGPFHPRWLRWKDAIDETVQALHARGVIGTGGSVEVEYVKTAGGTVYLYFRTVTGTDTAGDKRIGFNTNFELTLETFTGSTWVEGLTMAGSTLNCPGDSNRIITTDLTQILFSDLGSGATDSIAIAAFPTDAILVGISAVATVQFTGEADLTFIVGDTGDDNGLIASTALHETGNGTPIAIVNGVERAGQYETDWSTDGLAVGFAATELDDVTAGVLQVRIFYIPGQES